MLHYLVDIIEKKFPDMLNFSDELPHVDKAAKISTETIQKTLYQMEVNVKNLITDLSNSRLPQCEDDKFEEVMSVSFLNEFLIKTIVAATCLICSIVELLQKKASSSINYEKQFEH